MGSAFGVPVTQAVTTLSNRRIAVRARHVMGKAAFINVYDRASLMFIQLYNRLEDTPCAAVRLGVF